MVLEESTNITGWLLKKTNRVISWRKRFFILQNNKLVYYRSLRDNKPRAIFELKSDSAVVDYGVTDGYHQFSLYIDNQRVLWLAAEDNKARYWISVMRMEIDRMKYENGELSPSNENDMDIQPFSSECENTMYLRDIADSTCIPDSMKELSSLLHSSSLKTTLTNCMNGCLFMSIDSYTSQEEHPYSMLTMSLPIEMEYAAYFLVDCEYTRSMWDPLFLYSKEIEKLDNNNSIFHLFYKPITLLDFPCMIRSHSRDFCVHRHFSYDKESNSYFILFSSVTHPLCLPSSSSIRGDMHVGYRIEAVKSGVSRITMIYSFNPQGHLAHYPHFAKKMENQFIQSLPGLRDMLCQIPDYHILNLIERIVKGIRSISSESSESTSEPSLSLPIETERPSFSTQSSSEPSISVSTQQQPEEKEEMEEEETSSLLLPPYITNTVPHASECDLMNNCWEEVDGTTWNIRGISYLTTKEKVRSEISFCKLLCVDVFQATSRISHIAQYPDCALHHMNHLKSTTKEPILIINLQIAGNISIVAYFAIPIMDNPSPAQKLLSRFIHDENDTWRDNHLKLLPHIVEGGYLIKKAVGTTPCIIGTKGESSYYTGETPLPYFECDYDMDGSTVARNLSKYLFTASNMVVELGFVIQGEKEDELPEHVLGGFRFYHLDINSAKRISILFVCFINQFDFFGTNFAALFYFFIFSMSQLSIATFFKPKKVDTLCSCVKATEENLNSKSPTSVVFDCISDSSHEESVIISTENETSDQSTILSTKQQDNNVEKEGETAEDESTEEEGIEENEEIDESFRKWAESKEGEDPKESKVKRNAKNMKLLVNKAVTFVEEMQKQIEINTTPSSSEVFQQPKSLKGGKLFPHQLEAIDWLRRLFENGSHGILADEMGLGKTIEVIGLLASLREEGVFGCVLIIAPLSTLGNWVDEFHRWLPDVNVVKYHGNKEERHNLHIALKDMKDTVVITSYEMIRMDTSFFVHHSWFYLIVDEGHRLKNNESQLMQCLFTFSHSPETSRLILTGTPLQNNLKELWSLLNFILPDIFSSVTDFLKWFDFNNSESEATKVNIVNTLRKVISPFFLRRVKADIDIYLPPKREFVLFCGMSKFEEELYDVVCSNDSRFMELIETSHLHLQSKSRINRIQILRQIVSHPYNVYEEKNANGEYITNETMIQASSKLSVLDTLLKTLFENGHRVLIFVQFVETLMLLSDYATYRGWEYCSFHGTITQVEREKEIARFNENPSIPLFFLTTHSGGLGINLSSADTVILYDSDWNPQQDIQAMDRVHRIGQKKNVAVYQFITLNSIDVHLLKIAEEKRQLERIVTHHTKSNPSLKTLTFEEFVSLYNANELKAEGATAITTEKVKELALIHASGKIEEKGDGYRIMHRSGQEDCLSKVNEGRVVAAKRPAQQPLRRSTRSKRQCRM